MYYTVKEIAEKLKMKQNSVFRLIRKGLLKSIDVSSGAGKRPRYRIRQEAFEEFIEIGKNKK